jgi:hypothetical protein
VYKLYTFFDGCNVLVLPLQHFTFVLNQIALTTMKRMLNRMLRFYKIKAAPFFRRVTRLLKKTTRLETAEKTDAGRVAPISARVFYQIDRLKSGFEAMGRTVMPGNCALMGATRLASGFFQQPHLASGIFQQPRDASPPLVLAFFLDFITFQHHLIGWRIDEVRDVRPPLFSTRAAVCHLQQALAAAANKGHTST